MGYVYLAEPIDYSAKRTELAESSFIQLARSGVSIYSPFMIWRTNGSAVKSLQDVNETAIAKASALVAVMDGTFTIGVPAELAQAKMYGVPTAILTTPEIIAKSQVLQSLATIGVFTDPVELAGAVIRFATLTAEHRIGQIQREPRVRQFPLPWQRKPGDVGLDLYVSEQVIIPPGEWRGIPSRVKVAPPPDVWFLITGRSSTLHRRGLVTITSVIDSGFRGDLFSLCRNISESEVTIEPGERVAQLIPMMRVPFMFTETDRLTPSERGESGFGSTGA